MVTIAAGLPINKRVIFTDACLLKSFSRMYARKGGRPPFMRKLRHVGGHVRSLAYMSGLRGEIKSWLPGIEGWV